MEKTRLICLEPGRKFAYPFPSRERSTPTEIYIVSSFDGDIVYIRSLDGLCYIMPLRREVGVIGKKESISEYLSLEFFLSR